MIMFPTITFTGRQSEIRKVLQSLVLGNLP
jgi:hypothetical protein